MEDGGVVVLGDAGVILLLHKTGFVSIPVIVDPRWIIETGLDVVLPASVDEFLDDVPLTVLIGTELDAVVRSLSGP